MGTFLIISQIWEFHGVIGDVTIAKYANAIVTLNKQDRSFLFGKKV